MKKLFTLLLAVAASVGTVFAWDYERVQIGDLYYNLDATNQTAEVTSPSSGKYSGEIIIPSSVTYNEITYSVTSIGDGAFSSCSGLTSVMIPNSVTSIGYQAFYGCNSLASVTIPNSVTSIGNSVFAECTSFPVIDNIRYADTYLIEAVDKTLSTYTIKDGTKWIGERAFFECINLTSVTIPNSITSIGSQAFCSCYGLTFVTIGNSVTSIGGYAFYMCSGLTSLTIPNSVTSIGENAFFGCRGLTSITCEVATPPTLGSNVFSYVDTSIPLYVPAGRVSAYKSADQWKDFTNILPISAQETETTSVQAEPTDNSVSVSWPQVSGAASYELVIKDKDGNVVCTLIFNAQGQLQSIAFHAPARENAPQQTQTAGFLFTITGLEAGTDYNLTITAKNSNDQVVNKREVSFHTNWPSAIENLQVEGDQSVKVYHEGHIYILRGEKVYTVTGQEVK